MTPFTTEDINRQDAQFATGENYIPLFYTMVRPVMTPEDTSRTDQDTDNTEPNEEAGERRTFLKAAAAGAAGLGIGSLLPTASAFRIDSTNSLTYYGDGSTTPDLEVDTDGTLHIPALSGDITDNTEITDLVGDNLSIDDGTLNAVDGERINPASLGVQDWNWIDMVEAGADPTGTENVVPIIEANAADNTLLVFPEGEYLFEEEFHLADYENFGIRGMGDVVFKKDSIEDTILMLWFGTTQSGYQDGLYIENITFDFSNPGEGSRALQIRADDRVLIRNIDIVGEMTYDAGGGGADSSSSMRLTMTDEDGRAWVEDYRATDGSTEDNGGGGIYTGDNLGKCYFVNCRIENWKDNGLYGSGSGPLHVEGGVWKNNAISNIRFQTENCSAHNAKIFVDNNDLEIPRGVWILEGTGHVVSNCDITYDGAGADGVIAFHSNFEGTATIRDCHIRVDTVNEDWTIRFTGSSDDHADDVDPVRFENCLIEYLSEEDSGDPEEIFLKVQREGTEFHNCIIRPLGGSDPRTVMRIYSNAHESVIHNCHIESEGDGILSLNRENLRVTDTTLETGGTGIVLEGNNGNEDALIRNVNGSITIDTNCEDTVLENTDQTTITDNGIRTVIDGISENSGDPNVEGQWNGNARPGVIVEDTQNDELYVATVTGDWIGIVPKSGGTFTGNATVNDGVTYEPQSEPATPDNGWILYTDQNDGNLKAKYQDGTTETLASPE